MKLYKTKILICSHYSQQCEFQFTNQPSLPPFSLSKNLRFLFFSFIPWSSDPHSETIRITVFRLVHHFFGHPSQPMCVSVCVCVSLSFLFLFLIYCIRFQHLSLHPIILWFIFIVPTLFSQQPLQHLHVTLLTEGCVFAGHRVTANRKHWISPLINCGKKEFPLPLSSSEGVYVCVRVHTRVPKLQESLRHHPARTLTQQASLSL